MRALVFAAAILLSGCALTSNAPPVEVREFSPEPASGERGGVRPAAAPGLEVRLGRVQSSANLRRHIVYRVSDVEVGEYEDWQWTENPEEYVRRAVTRDLFELRGAKQAVGGPHPTLDLEVTAFEEVRRGDARLGRVRVAFVLRDEKHVIDSGTLSVEKPSRSAAIEDVVGALSSALGELARQLGDRVVAAASTAPAATP